MDFARAGVSFVFCMLCLPRPAVPQGTDFIDAPPASTQAERAVAAGEIALLVAENSCHTQVMGTWTSAEYEHVELSDRHTPRSLYLSECEARSRSASRVREIQLRVTPALAVVRGYWIGHGRLRGEIVKIEISYIRVWTRSAQGWKAVFYQETGGPPPE